MTHDELIKTTGQIAISDKQLGELIEEERAFLTDYFAKGQKSLPPTLHVYHRKLPEADLEKTVGIFTEFPPDRKHEMLAKFGDKLGEESDEGPAVLAILISEAWAKTFSKKNPLSDVAVRDYEDKTEVIVVVAMTLDRRTYMVMYKTIRDDKTVITLEEVKDFLGVGVKAPLLESFWHGYTLGLGRRIRSR